MGCDGGTIPRRDELVRVKKKPETKDKDAELAFQWRCCAITQQVLQNPIVVCGLGRLYNKVTLIEYLLNRDILPDFAKHIRSLKDVKDLNLTPNPEYKGEDEKKGDSADSISAPFICPVIGLEMSGKFRFVAVWNCGCVFSERALKEIDNKVCHKCQKPFQPDDIVIINGNEEDLELMKKRMELRKPSKKKNKEKKEIKVEQPFESIKIEPSTSKVVTKRDRSTNWDATEKDILISGIKFYIEILEDKTKFDSTNKQKDKCWKEIQKRLAAAGYDRETSRIKEQWRRMKGTAKKNISNYSQAMRLTSGGLKLNEPSQLDYLISELITHELVEDTNAYDSDSQQNGNKSSIPSSSTTKIVASKRPGAVEVKSEDVRVKKAKADYSVAKDPNASDVYKSLFTTHKSEKEQTRAHWITYNPFYN